MLHTKFRGNRSRRFLNGFYYIWLKRPSWSCDQHHVIRFIQSFQKKLVQIGTVVSEKIRFEFLYVHDLGQRSKNYLDLQY